MGNLDHCNAAKTPHAQCYTHSLGTLTPSSLFGLFHPCILQKTILTVTKQYYSLKKLSFTIPIQGNLTPNHSSWVLREYTGNK